MSAWDAFAERRAIWCFAVLAMLVCAAAALCLGAHEQPSLLQTANKLGPAAESLVRGRGLAVCYGLEDASCFHAQRMPVAPITLAALYLLFHEHRLPAAVVKTLVCFAPVVLAFALVWRRAGQGRMRMRFASQGIFFLALLLPPTLDVAVNLNFEEAYFYGPFALAVTLLLFADSSRLHPWRWTVLLWLMLSLCFLTKSAILPAAGFLAVMAAVYAVRCLQRPRLAAMIVLAFACVPLLWGAWQHHVSGRFTMGTSLDGVNLYKGNNPLFLEHYPVFRGASLDMDEARLFADHVSLTDEWDENDFGLAAARSYMQTHPAATVQAAVRKASVFFLGVQRNAGGDTYPPLIEDAFTAGLVVFRAMLLAAMGLATWQVFAAGGNRFAALVFLGSVVCLAAPYLAGFALTRHATVLVFPSAAYLCRVFLDVADQPLGPERLDSFSFQQAAS